MARGRHIGLFGEAFPGTDHSEAEAAPTGQPVMVRMQGVPTMPGYRDRPGKWNAVLPPISLAVLELVRRLLERLW